MLPGTAAAAEFPPYARQFVLNVATTISAAHANSSIFTTVSGFALTFPAPTIMAPGAYVLIGNLASPTLTLTPGGGVTLNDSGGNITLVDDLSGALVIAESATNWSVIQLD